MNDKIQRSLYATLFTVAIAWFLYWFAGACVAHRHEAVRLFMGLGAFAMTWVAIHKALALFDKADSDES